MRGLFLSMGTAEKWVILILTIQGGWKMAAALYSLSLMGLTGCVSTHTYVFQYSMNIYG